ncbi:MAG: CRISPR-associated protein Cas4 [Coriobacteriales bacterium]|nr:CRISPR-associated protein Cas4 [Coriobacteriales bacterium]
MLNKYNEDEFLALSGLQHLAFCERQWYLIHIEQVWEENADTLHGEFFHERVDTQGYSCVKGIRSERRIMLVSKELGIYGVADIVEFSESNPLEIQPIEYKVGSPKVADWDRVQLTAQAMCLEEMYSCKVPKGAIFYGETRHREYIEIDDKLRKRVHDLCSRMHELYITQMSCPARKSAKCSRCSLANICLPEAFATNPIEYWRSFDEHLVEKK